jgi:signal transduction histidine kinase
MLGAVAEQTGRAEPALPTTVDRHFSDAVAAIRQPFVVYDTQERLVAFNAAFSDLHREADGSPVLYPGMTFQELMEWRMLTGFFASATRRGGHAANGEYRLAKGDVIYQLRDGRWMFVDSYSLPDGRLACTWSDITAVKAAERQLWELTDSLRQSQDHLLRAQRIAHVGSIERDLRTGSLRWTAEMYHIFGRDPDLPPPSREQMLQMFHPEDRARYQEALCASEEGRPTAPAEFRILRPDGSLRWIYHESEVFFDEQGRPAVRIATYKDVTEVHEYQEQERALQAELLSRERLSAIGEISATVTHELRNPLSTIKNTLHLVKELAADGQAPTSRLLDRIERSIDRCNRIIGDMLEYSRAGPARRRAQNLDPWLSELANEPSVPPEVRLTFDLGAPGVHVGLDASRFRRALTNLLDNAVQATRDNPDPKASPCIVLRTRRVGDWVECTVEDNGAGMSDEALAHAFEPLYSTKTFGTGLGLPIVKHIVGQHDGEVSLCNIERGVRATIRLPIVEETGVARARPTAV